MSLSRKLKNASADSRPYTIQVGDGLGLYIDTKGKKTWRMRYRFAGKARLKVFGPFPEIDIEAAKERRNDLRKLVAQGRDPKLGNVAKSSSKKITLKECSKRFLMSNKVSAKRESAIERNTQSSANPLAHVAVDEITPTILLDIMRDMIRDGRSADWIKRTFRDTRMVLQLAVAEGDIEYNPVQSMFSFIPEWEQGHIAAQVEESPLTSVIRKIGSHTPRSGRSTLLCLNMLPVLFCRPGELASARWQDIGIDDKIWIRQISKKMPGKPARFLVTPLPDSIVEAIDSLPRTCDYLFPARKNPHITTTSVGEMMAAAGIPGETATPHGFRATARTLLRQRFKYPLDVIHCQLGHKTKSQNGEAYDRTDLIDERREMLEEWSGYLDQLRGHPIKL